MTKLIKNHHDIDVVMKSPIMTLAKAVEITIIINEIIKELLTRKAEIEGYLRYVERLMSKSNVKKYIDYKPKEIDSFYHNTLSKSQDINIIKSLTKLASIMNELRNLFEKVHILKNQMESIKNTHKEKHKNEFERASEKIILHPDIVAIRKQLPHESLSKENNNKYECDFSEIDVPEVMNSMEVVNKNMNILIKISSAMKNSHQIKKKLTLEDLINYYDKVTDSSASKKIVQFGRDLIDSPDSSIQQEKLKKVILNELGVSDKKLLSQINSYNKNMLKYAEKLDGYIKDMQSNIDEALQISKFLSQFKGLTIEDDVPGFSPKI
jgi:hypothetical protein